MRVAIYIAGLIVVLGASDYALSDRRAGGPRRILPARAHQRIQHKPDARVLLLGQSTMADWSKPKYIAKLLGLPEAHVVLGAIGGCQAGCSWAEVRRLLAEGRHYEKVFFGLNLYTMCETPKAYRNLQQLSQLPLADYPAMLRITLASESPLQQYGQMLGLVSAGYGDREYVQRRLTHGIWGPGRNDSYRWKRPTYKKPDVLWTCRYKPHEVALKHAYTDAMLADLEQLADRSFLIVLPDKTWHRPEQYGERWTRHRTALRGLAERYSHVEYMELLEGGASEDAHYRDVAHLKGDGFHLQRRLFKRKLRAAGVKLPKKRRRKKAAK